MGLQDVWAWFVRKLLALASAIWFFFSFHRINPTTLIMDLLTAIGWLTASLERWSRSRWSVPAMERNLESKSSEGKKLLSDFQKFISKIVFKMSKKFNGHQWFKRVQKWSSMQQAASVRFKIRISFSQSFVSKCAGRVSVEITTFKPDQNS